jgi:colanic acid biosynthesis glycosyl transferase WcaI
MASARPVVGNVPLSGDAPAIVEAARCGICVEPDRADKLAEAILKLYREPSLAEEMGNNGRRQAERFFSREACTKAYEKLLLSLLSKI